MPLGSDSSVSSHSGKVVQLQRMPAAIAEAEMSPARSRLRTTMALSASAQGASVNPQLPMTTLVIPCQQDDVPSGSQKICASMWVWPSTKPGATTMPSASMTSRAASRMRPMDTMRPWRTATSACWRGWPVPSISTPFLISRSWGISVLSQVEGLGEAAIALERVAVLAMAGGVLGAGQQQALAIVRLGGEIALERAEPQLLVVRIVAGLACGGGQGLHQRRALEARLEIGGGEIHPLVGPERDQRFLQPVQQLARPQPGDAGRHRDRARSVVGRVTLVLGRVVDERRGDEQELESVRMLERVEEPGQRVAVLEAVLRHRVVI